MALLLKNRQANLNLKPTFPTPDHLRWKQWIGISTMLVFPGRHSRLHVIYLISILFSATTNSMVDALKRSLADQHECCKFYEILVCEEGPSILENLQPPPKSTSPAPEGFNFWPWAHGDRFSLQFGGLRVWACPLLSFHLCLTSLIMIQTLRSIVMGLFR